MIVFKWSLISFVLKPKKTKQSHQSTPSLYFQLIPFFSCSPQFPLFFWMLPFFIVFHHFWNYLEISNSLKSVLCFSLCSFLLSSWLSQGIHVFHKYGSALSNSHTCFRCCCLLSSCFCFPSINSCPVFFPRALSASVLIPLVPFPLSAPSPSVPDLIPTFLNFVKNFSFPSHVFFLILL